MIQYLGTFPEISCTREAIVPTAKRRRASKPRRRWQRRLVHFSLGQLFQQSRRAPRDERADARTLTLYWSLLSFIASHVLRSVFMLIFFINLFILTFFSSDFKT